MKRPLFLPFPIELRIWGIVGYFCALCKCHLFMMLTTNHKAVLYVEKITKRFLQVILLFQTFLVHREKLKTSVSETNNYKCQITSRLLALISIHFAIYLWSGIKFLSCSPVDYNIMSKLKIPVNMSCTGKKDYHSYASICHPLWFFFYQMNHFEYAITINQLKPTLMWRVNITTWYGRLDKANIINCIYKLNELYYIIV